MIIVVLFSHVTVCTMSVLLNITMSIIVKAELSQNRVATFSLSQSGMGMPLPLPILSPPSPPLLPPFPFLSFPPLHPLPHLRSRPL